MLREKASSPASGLPIRPTPYSGPGIAAFTETTDQMESEDLTHLLNQYLTEMSRIALAHGATIDKYVGDALMIFLVIPRAEA